MREIARRRYVAPDVVSLAWAGDDLVDYAGGSRRFHADGSISTPHIHWAFSFDRAVVSPSGAGVVLYDSLGTKGLVLKDGRLVREINRSFYHAAAYEYPVALGRLPNGREVLVHCPEEYNELQVEELESGRRLTERAGKAVDFFHARLQVSDDGRYLLSAGWVWHPADYLALFDLAEALRDPTTLDGDGVPGPPLDAEVEAAAFDGANLVVAADPEDEPYGLGEARMLAGGELGVWSPAERAWVRRCRPAARVGALMPLGDAVVGFYDHPKLIDLANGAVLQSWPELASGRQTSSIVRGEPARPPLALDPGNARFAVGDAEGVTVVQLG